MVCWSDRFANYCIAKQIISPADRSWFKYGLEKRIYSIVVSVPFLLTAIILSDMPTAITFFISFYCLRSRTNGFHARTVWWCFALSIFFEIVFIGVIQPLISIPITLLLAIISAVFIHFLAPYNHPNMHLSPKEISICRLSSRLRASGILACILISYILGLLNMVIGFSLGLVMAACLLCLAYINEWRKTLHEKIRNPY